MSTDERPFLEQIESFFLETVQQGLALRPSDVEITKDWEKRGVPVEVVRKGIADGIQRFLATAAPSQPLPGVLKYYRTFVETEFETWKRAKMMGLGIASEPVIKPVDMIQAAINVLSKWNDQAQNSKAKALFSKAITKLENRPQSQSAVELIGELDDWLALELLDNHGNHEWRDSMKSVLEAAQMRGVGFEALKELEKAQIRLHAQQLIGYTGLVNACLDWEDD